MVEFRAVSAGMVFVFLVGFTENPDPMEETGTLVSPSEFQNLLCSIAHHQPHICIRYRSMGHLWYPNFLKVLKIQEPGKVLFHDEFRKKIISFSGTSHIVQFELDSRFLHYEPNYHYQVSDENYCKGH